jgi:hypothetical protein
MRSRLRRVVPGAGPTAPPFMAIIVGLSTTTLAASAAQTDDPSPPDHVVRLIFIHHSTGENWLMDDYGGLGRALSQNNYFVSDTNYGWGPDSIGDRTDIPDWLEWFRSAESGRYLEALYQEGGQHAEYTRTLSNPGGENEIIQFKSCFPNSNLEGSPGDPPSPEPGYTVGHAKYVYNRLLEYFATRPDRLFVVITAPPVEDPTYATNARSFNNWLVYDWLAENNYTMGNVAVFDFYNVLTGPDNHHRHIAGSVQHTYVPRMDTAYYPSSPGDDHPSIAGSRRATEEFIPLLNVYYHRWRSGAPPQAYTTTAVPWTEPQTQPGEGQPGALDTGVIDDFEAGPPAASSGWEPAWDASTPTSIACDPASGDAHSGSGALRIDFNVSSGSWATCALFFDSPQDWSHADGLAFLMRGDPAALAFEVNVLAGGPEAAETYLLSFSAPSDWTGVSLDWPDLQRAAWEENGGQPFGGPARVRGLAFGFSPPEDAAASGTLWVDDLRLTGGEIAPPAGEAELVDEGEPGRGPGLPCMAAVALPLGLAAVAFGGTTRRGRFGPGDKKEA